MIPDHCFNIWYRALRDPSLVLLPHHVSEVKPGKVQRYPWFAALITGLIKYALLSCVCVCGGEPHCSQIKVIFQAPTHACALIKKITVDVLMMCKGGWGWGWGVECVFLYFCISAFWYALIFSPFPPPSPLCLAPPPSPRSPLNLGQSLILNEFCLTWSLLPFPSIPPSFFLPLATHQLSTTHIPPLSIPYWIKPRQAPSPLVAVSPWRPVSWLMIGWSWCLTSGLVEHREGGSLFLWVGCRGIEEDLRACCDPYSNTLLTRLHLTPACWHQNLCLNLIWLLWQNPCMNIFFPAHMNVTLITLKCTTPSILYIKANCFFRLLF